MLLRGRSRLVCAVLLACLSGPPDAAARVSLRLPGDVRMILAAAGGTQVYAADVAFNGRPATLRAFVFDADIERVGAEVLTRLGLDAGGRRAGAMLKVPGSFGAGWLFLLPGMTGDVASGILIEPRGPDRGMHPEWLFTGLQQPSGLTLGFSAWDQESRFALGAGVTHLPPAAALAVLRGSLERAGWTAATPASESVSAVFFAKGDEVALASSSPREAGGGRWLLMTTRRSFR